MRLVFCLLSLCCLLSMALAATPAMISYQGKLTKADGTPLPDGANSLTFAIYAQPTGGLPLWSEQNTNVQVKKGLFSVLLGSVNNLPANIFDGTERWFGVTVGADPEMTPRQLIASVPYAVRAGSAAQADSAETVNDGAVTTGKIADGAVTSEKIADAAIKNGNISDNAITSIKLADKAITASKIETQQAWIAPTLTNGWVNYAPGDFPMGYMKDSLGFVHITGQVSGGAAGMASVFTLPAGYRPAYWINYVGNNNDSAFCGSVSSSGVLLIKTAPSPTSWFHINISFKAEN